MIRVIHGCGHTRERMVEWVDNGACPVCLTADCGMLKEKLKTAVDALEWIEKLKATFDPEGASTAELLRELTRAQNAAVKALATIRGVSE